MNNQPVVHKFQQTTVSDKAYQAIREFIYKEAGINLGDSKQQLVSSRLTKRLKNNNLTSFDDYADLIQDSRNSQEQQMAIDLLTTNETYFFREAAHFDSLKTNVLQQHPKERLFRVWSAASSSGEEAYSIAMVLDDYFGNRVKWEIFGSDISSRIIKKASSGLYQAHRIDAIPKPFLKRYCRKGKGQYEGFLLVNNSLRDRTKFSEINLTRPLPEIGLFDVIFLRNVLIYFDNPTKEKIIQSLESKLRPGGILYIGHSESLKGMDIALSLIAPTTYQKK
ncbi:MAG: protein-glutamate O-methyltransferase [Gammaproteobacteria bacterium]|nr:protein-glutamate O-methyltransferase [Gammaproteobacteria bacterium]